MRLNSNSLCRGLFLLLTVALCSVSCNRSIIYSHYEPVDAEGWLREDTVHFEVAPPPLWHPSHNARTADSPRRTVLCLHLRTTSVYPFTDLLLRVEQHTPTRQRFDTVRLQLSDTEGRPLGRGQGLYQHTFRLPVLPLSDADTLRVAFSHLMQLSPLPGITDVGLSLE